MTDQSYQEGQISPLQRSPKQKKLGLNNNKQPRTCNTKIIQGYFMTFHTVASIAAGIYCYLSNYGGTVVLNELSLLMLLSALMVVICLTASLLTTAFFVVSLFCINRTKARSSLGCVPILYPFFLFMGYGVNTVLGIIILSDGLNMDAATLAFVIYEIAAGVFFYGLLLYKLIIEPGQGISPHLMEMERSTFKLNESEIKLVREEVKLQMIQIEPEKPKAVSAAPVKNLHFGSKKIVKTTKRIKDEKSQRRYSTQSSTSDESYDDLEKNFGGIGFVGDDDDRPRIESVKKDPKTRTKSLMKPRLRLYKPKV
jgi:hypothetical protein